MIKGKISKKIMAVNVFIILIILGFIGRIYFYQKDVIIKKTYSELSNINAALIGMLKTSYKSSVKSYLLATSNSSKPVIEHIYAGYTHGEYTKDEALELISELFHTSKLGKSGYSSLIDVNAKKVLTHPYIKQIENIDKTDFMKKALSLKHGYIEYRWKNYFEKEEREKIAYLNYLKEWELILVTSVYKDEFTSLINVDSFRDEVLSLKFDKDGYSYIITDKGKIVLHPTAYEGQNWYFKADRYGKRFIKEICDKKNGSISYYYGETGKQREKLTVYDYVPELGWIIVSGSYMDNFMYPVLILRLFIILSVILLVLLSVIQHNLIKRFVVFPIESFVLSIKKIIKSGDLCKIQIDSVDEINELSSEFNILIDHIKAYEDNLESLVEQKTTELKNRKDELKKVYHASLKNEKLLNILFETIPDPIFFKDENFNFIKCNSAFASYLDLKKEDIYGKNGHDLFPKDIADLAQKKDDIIFRKLGTQKYETKVNLPNQSEEKTMIINKAVCILDNKKIGIVGLIQDVTDLRKMEEKLKEENIKDHLTSLYNRRGIEEFGNAVLRNSIRNKNGMAVLMIDVDYFKLFNDRYGHQSGDECLIRVSKEIKNSCYRSMDLAGRYGGEEFIVILPNITHEGALAVANRINQKIKELKMEHLGNKDKQVVTASIGIYFAIPNTNFTLEKYIQLADENLYKAKKNGRDQVQI